MYSKETSRLILNGDPDKEWEVRTIVGCKTMLEALLELVLVCILGSRFGSQSGSSVEAEPKLREERKLE